MAVLGFTLLRPRRTQEPEPEPDLEREAMIIEPYGVDSANPPPTVQPISTSNVTSSAAAPHLQ
jgi:hypothetical protein